MGTVEKAFLYYLFLKIRTDFVPMNAPSEKRGGFFQFNFYYFAAKVSFRLPLRKPCRSSEM